MLEMSTEFGEAMEGPVEWSSDLLPEMDDMTHDPGSFLERAMDFADAEAIQTFFVELVDNLQESFGEALDAYLDKVAENATERQTEIERPLRGEEAIYTESEVRAMVEEAIDAYERGYQAGLAESAEEAEPKAAAEELAEKADPKVAEEVLAEKVEPAETAELRQPETGEVTTDMMWVETYTVVPGDCLWKIAQREYGDASKWPAIYEANREVIGGNPDLIHPGQEFVIPPLEEIETPATVVSSEPPVYVALEPPPAQEAPPVEAVAPPQAAATAPERPTPEPPAEEAITEPTEAPPPAEEIITEPAEAPPPTEAVTEPAEAPPPAEAVTEETAESPQEADAAPDVGVETLTVEETLAPVQEMVDGLQSSEVDTAYFLTDEPMEGDRVVESVSGSITVDSQGQVVSTSSRTEYSDGTFDASGSITFREQGQSHSGSITVESQQPQTSGAEQPVSTGLEQVGLQSRTILTMQGPKIIQVEAIPSNAIPSNMTWEDLAADVWEAIPSNAIPSNMTQQEWIQVVEEAIPSNAIPSNMTVEEAAQVVWRAIPSNAIPSNFTLGDATAAIREALPASALPSSLISTSGLQPSVLSQAMTAGSQVQN